MYPDTAKKNRAKQHKHFNYQQKTKTFAENKNNNYIKEMKTFTHTIIITTICVTEKMRLRQKKPLFL